MIAQLDHIAMATGASVAIVRIVRHKPLERIQRGVVLMRAAGFLIAEMIEGAKLRVARWPECVERARRI